MCLIRFRPDCEDEVIIPSRPLRTELPALRHGRSTQSLTASNNEHGQTALRGQRSRERARTQDQAVVIEQIFQQPSWIQIRHGSSYTYGDGPVPAATPKKPLDKRNDSQQDPGPAARVRRSGSLA